MWGGGGTGRRSVFKDDGGHVAACQFRRFVRQRQVQTDAVDGVRIELVRVVDTRSAQEVGSQEDTGIGDDILVARNSLHGRVRQWIAETLLACLAVEQVGIDGCLPVGGCRGGDIEIPLHGLSGLIALPGTPIGIAFARQDVDNLETGRPVAVDLHPFTGEEVNLRRDVVELRTEGLVQLALEIQGEVEQRQQTAHVEGDAPVLEVTGDALEDGGHRHGDGQSLVDAGVEGLLIGGLGIVLLIFHVNHPLLEVGERDVSLLLFGSFTGIGVVEVLHVARRDVCHTDDGPRKLMKLDGDVRVRGMPLREQDFVVVLVAVVEPFLVELKEAQGVHVVLRSRIQRILCPGGDGIDHRTQPDVDGHFHQPVAFLLRQDIVPSGIIASRKRQQGEQQYK